jgi:hypothetical protein
MIHIRLKNGQTLLFDEKELVTCTNWLHGDYIGELRECRAKDLLRTLPFKNKNNFVLKLLPNREIIEDDEFAAFADSPIVEVKQLSYSFFGRV